MPDVPITGTAASLQHVEFPPQRWIVPDIIPTGCTLIAGPPKIGKSWLVLDIALAVSNGTECLGHKCEQGEVLYLALEDNPRRLHRRIAQVLGVGGQWPADLHYTTESKRADAGGIAAMRPFVKRPKARLVIVDVIASFRKLANGKNSYDLDYQAISELQRLVAPYEVALLIVHHTRKNPGFEVDFMESVSGTLGLSGAADATIVLARSGTGSTLAGRGRDVENFDLAVEFDADACRWHVLGDAATVRRSTQRSAIMTALSESAEPLSPKDLAALTSLSHDAVRKLLSKMVRAGEVEPAGYGKYKTGGPGNAPGSED